MADNLTPIQRAEYERQAWALSVDEELTTREIGQRLGVHHSTVARMLRRVEARLAGEFVGAELDRRARISAQLEQVVAEAWAAWRSTQGPVETVTTVTGRAELSRDGLLVDLPDQVTTQRKVQAGEAALLGKVLDGLAALRALHGVDEPKAVDVTSGGEPIKLYSCVPVDEV